MKIYFLILIIFCPFILKAQIVTIPDANFKTAILNHDPVIDAYLIFSRKHNSYLKKRNSVQSFL